MLGLSNLLISGAYIRTIAQKLASSFRSRVTTDGGVFEAKACLEAQLTNLNNIE